MNQLAQSSQQYIQHGGTIAGYPQAPKEIGYCQRLEGLAGGLEELQHQLNNFANRVVGNPPLPPTGAQNAAIAPSIATSLEAAESRFRECLSIVNRLHELF